MATRTTTTAAKPAARRKAARKPAQLTSFACHTPPVYEGQKDDSGWNGWGLIEINGVMYWVCCLGRTSRDGYRLVNLDNENVYDVDTSSGFPVCDCPDFLSRRTNEPQGCKHCLALRRMREQKVI